MGLWRGRILLPAVGLLAAGCPGDDDDDLTGGPDDDSAEGDDDSTAGDDDTGDDDDTGVQDCAPEDHAAGDCIDIPFQVFPLGFCTPNQPLFTVTIDDDTEWNELLTEHCTVTRESPEPPDWGKVMIVAVGSLGSGCAAEEQSVWFRECVDQRVYAYVQARHGDCDMELPLTTAIAVSRSQRVTRFVECGYTF